MDNSLKNKKIGLALGGGVVLGAAHIGVLRALAELGIKITHTSGTSIGALVATFFAFGKTWKEIEEIALELDWLNISRLTLSQFGLLSNEKLGKLIVDNIGDVEFSDSKIPLSMIALDISKGEKVILREGKVAEAVMASTAIPGLFTPLVKNGMYLTDGGVLENVPITPLRDDNVDVIIGVDLRAKQSYREPKNIIDILITSFDLKLSNANKLQTEHADILITPDLSEFDRRNTSQVPELIKKGYDVSLPILKKHLGY
ncbi:MAG: patatin-like phospholipase family protein [Melioribacteraceae bacterium]|nr:patatin-like phospholipase family protein [Melioribacteraceae bacterium]MCF8355393.1 patatin-like phospholipase family protein [Melioribacteraceae bacterium]MCF8394638.1 patatin-like phospholipase family protein [Melioribacteraceae bacterium]MCF8419635.1 patatin-like phospholipase family protein [Melioribacteraceae bacterium]